MLHPFLEIWFLSKSPGAKILATRLLKACVIRQRTRALADLLHKELSGQEAEADGLQQARYVTFASLAVEVDPTTNGIEDEFLVADVELIWLQHLADLQDRDWVSVCATNALHVKHDVAQTQSYKPTTHYMYYSMPALTKSEGLQACW